MAKARIEIGPDSRRVVERIVSRRKGLGLSQAEVAERLAMGARPMSSAVVGEIERGARRVDVDDLFAFANALEVTPEWLIALSAKARVERATELEDLARATAAEMLASIDDRLKVLEGVVERSREPKEVDSNGND